MIENACYVRDHCQISLLKLSEFKRINQLLFPLKSSENLCFSDSFMRNINALIHVSTLNITSEI